MVWKRPSNVEYPKVWHRFKGKIPMADGTIPTFRVQDIPPEMFEKALDFLCSEMVYYEPLCKATGLAYEPIGLKQMRDRWEEALKAKLGIICFMEKPENPNEIYPEIVGVNVTSIAYKGDVIQEHFQGESFPIVLGAINHTARLVDIFEKYNVDKYLKALALSVAQKYQGQSIGAEILKARVPLCKAVGLKVTATVFTAVESQCVARKAGFEELGRVSYEILTKLYGEALKTVTTKYSILMGLIID